MSKPAGPATAGGVKGATAAQGNVFPATIADLGFFALGKGRELTLKLHHPRMGELSVRVVHERSGPKVKVHDADLAQWDAKFANALPTLNRKEVEALLGVLQRAPGDDAAQAAAALTLLLKRNPKLGGRGEVRSLETLVQLRDQQRQAYDASKSQAVERRRPNPFAAEPPPAFPFPGSRPRNDGIPT